MAAVGDGAFAASEGLSEQSGDKEVLEILRRVENEEMGIVQASARLEEELRKRDLVYEATISPRQVGFDPVNRDGEGGNAQEVLLLATDIAFVGWSWQETRHAMCVEILPGDLAVENFNRQLCDGVGLAPVELHSIRFGSLSCGHTNMALRAIGLRCQVSAVSCPKGAVLAAQVGAAGPRICERCAAGPSLAGPSLGGAGSIPWRSAHFPGREECHRARGAAS